MTNERKKQAIDKTKEPEGSTLPKADYRFWFSPNLRDWYGKKTVRDKREKTY